MGTNLKRAALALQLWHGRGARARSIFTGTRRAHMHAHQIGIARFFVHSFNFLVAQIPLSIVLSQYETFGVESRKQQIRARAKGKCNKI